MPDSALSERATCFSVKRIVRAITFVCAWLGLGCLVCGSALGQVLTPHKVLGRYQQLIWQEQHGLPQNTVQAMTRTRDGYLWLGTQAGVARFDGARFTVFDSSNTAEIKGSLICALLEDAAGNLWIGTDGSGLNLFRDGRFSLYTTADGLPDDHIRALLEDRAGNLWIGTYGGLAQFKDGRFIVYTTRDGLPNAFVEALAEDGEGNLWIGTRGGLARFKDGRFNSYTTPGGPTHNIVNALCWDRAGYLWVATDGGLNQCKTGGLITEGLPPELKRMQIRAIYQDREGSIWFGTAERGLLRLKEGRLVPYTASDGLPENRIVVIYQDPEGDLWVGTSGGLSQLRDGRFQVYTTEDGLADDFVWAVYEDAAGSLWVSTNSGLTRFKDGKATTYTAKDGLPTHYIASLCEDPAGNLWLGTGGGGLVRFKDGRFTIWTTRDGLSSDLVAAVHADRAGNLWLATYGGGVNLFRDGRFTVYTTKDGLASDYVRVIFEDHEGHIWAGTRNGGISRFADGRFTTWATKEGTSNFVMSVSEDPSGALWINTFDEGLSRFKDGKFVTLTARDGLFDNAAFCMLADREDGSGSLWMSCNRGIYRVSLKDMNDFADGRSPSLTSFVYGISDGLLSRECNAASPAGWKTRDGRLWFATTKGLAAIDPRRQNPEPPLLAIEQVTLDSNALSVTQAIEIKPGQQNLEIHYTGLSWSRPQQIHFKYQLVGLDKTWVDAGTRRTAYYAHLPPGSYTFRVIADNGEGVWNTEGQSLPVRVLPPFYRTWWFSTLATLAMLSLATLAYQLRVRQLTRARAAQETFARRLIESQEQERKRIAAELHDGLGQNLLIIKNRAVMGLAPEEVPDATRQQLDEISSLSSQAIDEVREIAYNLRPYQIDRLGLTRAIESMIKRVAIASGIHFSMEVAQLKGVFSKESEINLYRIVQECINNIVKHSGASEAEVALRRNGHDLQVLIRDNGKGFAVEQALAPEAGQSGFGLVGIPERVRLLNGTFDIKSTQGQGTTISISVMVQHNHHGK